MDYNLFELQSFGDNRGSLISLEGKHNIPFDIKRVYYIYDTRKNVPRGFHAHKTLEQVVICVNGACKVKLDNGKDTKIVELNTPDKALYIGKNIWREMFDFSQGCVLMVVANEYYNPEEYIRDYDIFLKGIHNDIHS